VAKDIVVSQEMAEKFKTEKDTPYLRFVRAKASISSAPNMFPICARSSSNLGRAAPARASISTTKPRAPQRLLRTREIAPGKKLEPSRHLFEEMILILRRPRLDHDLEQCRPTGHFRVEGGLGLRRSTQLLVSALTRLRTGGRALRGGDQLPIGAQSL